MTDTEPATCPVCGEELTTIEHPGEIEELPTQTVTSTTTGRTYEVPMKARIVRLETYCAACTKAASN